LSSDSCSDREEEPLKAEPQETRLSKTQSLQPAFSSNKKSGLTPAKQNWGSSKGFRERSIKNEFLIFKRDADQTLLMS
jgi:hypothetical protein